MTSAKIFIGNIYTITACTILEEEVTVNHRTYKINKQQNQDRSDHKNLQKIQYIL